jgi:TRAP-type C4-dicarboxylate transport system permease small subunit
VLAASFVECVIVTTEGKMNRIWHHISNINRILISISGITVYVCILGGMCIIVVTDITMRTLFNSGIPGTIEIGEYLLVTVGFIALAQVQSLGGHITFDMVIDRFTPRFRYIAEICNRIILLLFSCLFIYASAKVAINAYVDGESTWFGIYIVPVWCFRWVIPIGMAMYCLQLINEVKKGEFK